MYYQVFGKRRCKFCTKAAKLLESKKIEYVITYFDKAPNVLKDLKYNLEWETVPMVLEVSGPRSTFLGGYTELEEYLNGSKTEEKPGRGEGVDVDAAHTVQAEGTN